MLDRSASLKRIAWAYGCAKKGSDEELALYNLLRQKILSEHMLTVRVEARELVQNEQALRARLAKTDMRPEARLRTLLDARHAGLVLTSAQQRELRSLSRTLAR